MTAKNTPEQAERAYKKRLAQKARRRAQAKQEVGSLADSWTRIMAGDPATAFRLIAIRQMIEHRGWTNGDVAKHMGQSKEWVSQSVRPSYVRVPGERARASSRSYEATHERLDRIEAAITEMTAERGGVFQACGCTMQAVTELIRVLRMRRDVLEEAGYEPI